jgi:hypothetical protein
MWELFALLYQPIYPEVFNVVEEEKKYSPSITQLYHEGSRVSRPLVVTADLESKMPFLLKALGLPLDENVKENSKFIRIINESDPTGEQAIYTPWLVKQYVAKQIRLPEDSYKVKPRLEFFHTHKNRGGWTGSKDINQYNYHSLRETVDEMQNTGDLRSKEEKNKGLGIVHMVGVDVLYNQDGWQVLKITSPEAAVAYASGTEWCTEHKENAVYYTRLGPLYVLIHGDEKYQFHFEDEQFMDKSDSPLYIDKFLEMRPVLEKVFTPLQTAKLKISMEFVGDASDDEDYTPDEKQAIADSQDVLLCYRYAESTQDRDKGIAAVLATSSKYALMYAQHVLHGPFPEAEKQLAKKAETASDMHDMCYMASDFQQGKKRFLSVDTIRWIMLE